MSNTTEKKVWHEQEEEILKKWSEIGSSYRYLHNHAYAKFVSMHTYFSLPVIILSTVAGTANFATQSFPAEWREYVSLCVGAINLTAGLITTISQFYKIPEKMEGHRAASIEFGKFARNIAVELSLPTEQRSKPGHVFVADCREEMDKLMEKCPGIPTTLVKTFGSRFKKGEFMKPDILEVLPVQVYRNTAEMKEREQARIDKIKAEAAREVRLQIESTADEVARRRHEMKKKRLSANHIADSMSRLITSIGNVVEDGKQVVDDAIVEVPKKESDSDITVCTVDDEEEEKE